MHTRETPESSEDIADAGLLQLREYIRTSLQSLPADSIRQLLQVMDERRRARLSAVAKFLPIADSSVAELQREVVWRLETLPPEDVDAITTVIRRFITRQR